MFYTGAMHDLEFELRQPKAAPRQFSRSVENSRYPLERFVISLNDQVGSFYIRTQKRYSSYICQRLPVCSSQLLFFLTQSANPVAKGAIAFVCLFSNGYTPDFLVARIGMKFVLAISSP